MSLILLQLTAIALSFVGGIFLAFSDFLMRSLSRTGKVSGISVMQTINKKVSCIVFMSLFLGLVPVSLLVAGYRGLVAGQNGGCYRGKVWY